MTTNSKYFLKRFSHNTRLCIAIRLIRQIAPKSMIDYGAGDGAIFLTDPSFSKEISDLAAFEPVKEQFDQLAANAKNISKAECLNILPNKTYDLVTCFEVLEHFEGAELEQRILELEQLISIEGKLIISVPIETGLSGLAKNLIRILIRQTHGNTSLLTIIMSLFSINISRLKGEGGYINSHIGFNHTTLKKALANRGLRLESKDFSPFNGFLGRIFASQVFYTFAVQ